MNNVKYISLKELNKKIENQKGIYMLKMLKSIFLKFTTKINNARYIKYKMKEHENFFTNIKGYSLDYEQKKSILLEEDSCLLIAGAGSGKTLTIIGKLKYLVNVKKYNPKRILCISFTNTITNELRESIYKELNVDIEVMTFHKLGIKILKENNIKFKIVNNQKLVEIIKKQLKKIPLEKIKVYFKNDDEMISIIETFINLYKAENCKDFCTIKEEIKKEKNRFIRQKNSFMIEIIEKIYLIYEKYLEKNLEIDFNDMINEASKLLKEEYLYPKYDYIIVDEYQDTSYSKYILLKELKEKNNCPIFAVGDDWQAIYRFTGCNIDIFTKFNRYFKYSYITKIQNTYRNPQQLIDIAGNFIMKNPYQIKKQLKANKTIKRPIKIFLYEKEIEFKNLLNQIPKGRRNILILGRNNNDITNLKIDIPNNFKYLTVHKSKGLECETAIIINLKDSMMGFPNKIIDDPIYKYILKKDLYPYEEERRLFYVALTRTKNEVYLFVPKNNKSIFVEELIKNFSNKIDIINSTNK